MRKVGQGQQFGQSISRPKALPPEANPWWWNPNRVGVRSGPDWFMERLWEIDPNLNLTWNTYGEHWSVWMRKDRLQSPICTGWTLLFHVHPRELDNRVFARLYSASADKWGSAKEYFLAIKSQMERDKAKKEKDSTQSVVDQAMETFDFSQIKVAMRGKSSGSKFSTYHA